MAGRVTAQEGDERHEVLQRDIGEFAGRTFDYYAAHPELARLLLWEGLAGGPAADEAKRTAHYQAKVAAVAAAQRDGLLDGDIDPAHLVFVLIALSAWWFCVPQLARMLGGADPDDPAERDGAAPASCKPHDGWRHRASRREHRSRRPLTRSPAPPPAPAPSGHDQGVTGRSCRTPSTIVSTFSLKNAIRFSIFGASGIGAG